MPISRSATDSLCNLEQITSDQIHWWKPGVTPLTSDVLLLIYTSVKQSLTINLTYFPSL